jgi:hypothetical protein
MIKTIIFFEINKNINIFLQKNNKDYYEDFILDYKDNILDLIPLYKIYIKENNNLIFLVDINRHYNIYKQFYDKYNEKIEKINYKYFINKAFHNNMKHKRLKNNIIQTSIDYIVMNRKINKLINKSN